MTAWRSLLLSFQNILHNTSYNGPLSKYTDIRTHMYISEPQMHQPHILIRYWLAQCCALDCINFDIYLLCIKTSVRPHYYEIAQMILNVPDILIKVLYCIDGPTKLIWKASSIVFHSLSLSRTLHISNSHLHPMDRNCKVAAQLLQHEIW